MLYLRRTRTEPLKWTSKDARNQRRDANGECPCALGGGPQALGSLLTSPLSDYAFTIDFLRLLRSILVALFGFYEDTAFRHTFGVWVARTNLL